jgi:hypothetical protein
MPSAPKSQPLQQPTANPFTQPQNRPLNHYPPNSLPQQQQSYYPNPPIQQPTYYPSTFSQPFPQIPPPMAPYPYFQFPPQQQPNLYIFSQPPVPIACYPQQQYSFTPPIATPTPQPHQQPPCQRQQCRVQEQPVRDRNRIGLGNEQQFDHRHHNYEPAIRTPSVDLPLFHGDNAAAWLLECEGIFDLAGIDNDHKIKWAKAHIHGKARVGYLAQIFSCIS